MAKTPAVDVRDKILNYLKEEDRTLAYLANKSEIPYATLYSIFVQRTFDLNEERLLKINSVLGTNFK